MFVPRFGGLVWDEPAMRRLELQFDVFPRECVITAITQHSEDLMNLEAGH